jgi:hypothetical protein
MTFLLVAVVTEATLVLLLLGRRVFRTLPVYCFYAAWLLLSDVGGIVVTRMYPTNYLRLFVMEMPVDSLLQFGVLVELTWSILRPLRDSLPRVTLVVIGAFFALAGVAIFPFVNSPAFIHLPEGTHLLLQFQLVFSILRVLFFLTLTGCSKLLSIGWRDRELQIATGLGFYSLASLSVSMLHTGQAAGPQYHFFDQIVVASFLCSLLYWIVCFAMKEPERRKFTPQMQNFLLTLAGTARTTRIALKDSKADKERRNEK